MTFSLSALWLRRIRGLWKLPDGRDWLRGKLGLVLMGGAMLSKSLIQFSIDGWSCFPSLLFTWGQTVVEVVKIMVISFKTSHTHPATLSAPNPAEGHCRPMPPLETPGHSWASLGQSPVGSLLLSPGFWCPQGSVCSLQESVSPVLHKFWWLYAGVNGDLLQECLCHARSVAPRALPLQQATADPYLHRRHSNTVLSQSLWGLWVLGCTRFVWALWASLAGMGFDSKHVFAPPPTILLGLLLCLWMWGIFSQQPLQRCAL